MSRPRLLDLFCGAGGAAVGYHRAGFDVIGVDNRPQPHYPFEFIEGDAVLRAIRTPQSSWLGHLGRRSPRACGGGVLTAATVDELKEKVERGIWVLDNDDACAEGQQALDELIRRVKEAKSNG